MRTQRSVGRNKNKGKSGRNYSKEIIGTGRIIRDRKETHSLMNKRVLQCINQTRPLQESEWHCVRRRTDENNEKGGKIRERHWSQE